MKRKPISKDTYIAALLYQRGDVPWYHARLMSAEQMKSLYELHHNVYHSWRDTYDGEIDHFTNLTPMLISEHREQTKRDRKILAKSRRLVRGKGGRPKSNKIQSRGFDRRLKRKFDGTVVPK